jgi:hypothetical protein
VNAGALLGKIRVVSAESGPVFVCAVGNSFSHGTFILLSSMTPTILRAETRCRMFSPEGVRTSLRSSLSVFVRRSWRVTCNMISGLRTVQDAETVMYHTVPLIWVCGVGPSQPNCLAFVGRTVSRQHRKPRGKEGDPTCLCTYNTWNDQSASPCFTPLLTSSLAKHGSGGKRSGSQARG